MTDPTPRPVTPLPTEIPRLRTSPAAPAPGGLNLTLDDVYYTLFRHKGKILLCTLLGLAAAGTWLSYRKLPYVSEAKLFIRYVVVEGMTLRPGLDDAVTKSPDMRGETIISSEQQIITSFDLLKQVAQAVGPDKVLAKAGGGNDLNAAANVISKGLAAEAPRFSSVINLSFRHPDPEIVQPVLRELVSLYFKRHVEIHRSAGMINDFLSQETDQLRTRLAQSEEELRKAKSKAGVISIEDSKKNLSEQMAKLRDQIFSVQAELAERQSIVQGYIKLAALDAEGPASEDPSAKSTNESASGTEPALPATVLEEFRTVVARLEYLRKREQELLLSFTAENPRVREVRQQLADTQAARQQLETTHPRLSRNASALAAATPVSRDTRTASIDPAVEATRINGLQAKLKALQAQVATLREEAAALETLEGNITALMRKKELEETNYRRYAASLEQSRINEAMGSGRVSNLSQIQTPSPPAIDAKKAFQLPAGMAMGGLGFGLVWAFLIELVLDRSVRRASDIEKKLKLPLFITIPRLADKPKRRAGRLLRLGTPPSIDESSIKTNGNVGSMPAITGSPCTAPLSEAVEKLKDELQPFHETLRDRLIGYFEGRGLTHKPKLVAVTGLHLKAGVTTTAAGLARSLSQTGDGNVLLVDLTPGQGAAHQFLHGQAVCDLNQLFSARSQAQVDNNLYVAAPSSNGDRIALMLPHQFRHLVPQLKASDFDYIIFDMPPVSQISITPRLAGFMDMVLLVMESEKTRLDVVQRATELLSESRAPIGAVLNQSRSCVPSFLHQNELSI